MTRRLPEVRWKTVLAAVALAAAALALHLHVFELQSRRQEARIAGSRIERAVEEMRGRLKAEILAEIEPGGAPAPGAEPLPDRVLRRREPGGEAPGQSLEELAEDRPPSLTGVAWRLGLLARRQDDGERALRRDLEELRDTVASAEEVERQVTSLALVALLALAAALLVPSGGVRRSGHAHGEETP